MLKLCYESWHAARMMKRERKREAVLSVRLGTRYAQERKKKRERRREGKLTVCFVARSGAGAQAETTQHDSVPTEGRGATDASGGRGGS